MVRLLDFALFEVNSYRVPKVQISVEELSLFRMLSVIKVKNFMDYVMFLTVTTLKPSFTLVFIRAEATYFSDIALVPVRWP